MQKKILVIGNYTQVQYHPLMGVDKELEAIFGSEYALTCTEDLSVLHPERLTQYGLCISYMDAWNYTVPKAPIAALISYVVNGGGLLVLHTGISLQHHYEFALMVGAKFTTHPAMETLTYRITAPEHPIMQGLSSFAVYEEPYQYILDNLAEREILLDYTLNGQQFPAAWVVNYGLGRVVYLMIGHTKESFLDPTYRAVVLRSGRWCMQQQ